MKTPQELFNDAWAALQCLERYYGVDTAAADLHVRESVALANLHADLLSHAEHFQLQVPK